MLMSVIRECVWLRQRGYVAAFVLLPLLAPSLRAQAPLGIGSTLGTVIRIRVSGAPSASGTRSRGLTPAGLLVQRHGAAVRFDVLQKITDSSSAKWVRMDSGTHVLRLYDDSTRATIVVPVAELRSLMTTVFNARFDSVSVDAYVGGAGPRVLGYETQRVTYTHRMVMRTSVGGRSQTLKFLSASDVLVAPALAEELGASQVLSLATNGTAALAELLLSSDAGSRAPRSDTPIPRGLALRTITFTETETTGSGFLAFRGENGRTSSTDTAEVISFERRRIDPKRLVAPANYREEDFGAMLKDVANYSRSVQRPGSQGGKVSSGSKPAKPSKP